MLRKYGRLRVPGPIGRLQDNHDRVLASVLPGIRELRTPLATGYIYLLSLFLLVGDQIPTKAEAQDPLRLLYDLVEWIGKPGALAAGTFVAYLVGSVLELPATVLGVGVRTPRPDPTRWMDDPWISVRSPRVSAKRSVITPASQETLRGYILDKLTHSLEEEVGPAEEIHFGRRTHGLLDSGLEVLIADFPQLRTRLYEKSKDLYGDYDRLAAEADLKVNVGLSTSILSIVASVVVEPWWALLCAPMGLLVYRGLVVARQANDVLVQAIVTDLVESPNFARYLHWLKAEVQRAEDVT